MFKFQNYYYYYFLQKHVNNFIKLSFIRIDFLLSIED